MAAKVHQCFLALQLMRYKLEINFFLKTGLTLEIVLSHCRSKARGKKSCDSAMLNPSILPGEGTGYSASPGVRKSLGPNFLSNQINLNGR